MMRYKASAVVILTLITSLGTACRPKKGKDPLKNTRQLVVRGHKSLYQNGAFRIPSSEISLIPPGPTPLEVAQDLVGLRARLAFLVAVREAVNSVYVVRNGSRYSFRVAEAINRKAAQIAHRIRTKTHDKGIWIVKRSFIRGSGIIADSFTLSRELLTEMGSIGDRIVNASWETGDAMKRRLTRSGIKIIKSSGAESARIARTSLHRSGVRMREGYKSFILGYAALPGQLRANTAQVGESLKKANLAHILKEENRWRKGLSASTRNIVVKAVTEYGTNIAESFRRAGRDLKAYKETGISLATLKAMRWVLKGLFWDAVLKPVSQVAFGGIGYILVNAVAFPTLVLIREGVAVANIAVQTSWNAAKSLFQIVAPTGTLAVASLFSIFDVAGSSTAAGVLRGGGVVAGSLEVARGHVGSVIIKGGGYAAGKTVQYIGVPLAAAGIAMGGVTMGTLYAVGGATPGAAVIVTGETAAVATRAFGVVLGGSVMTAGPVLATGVAGSKLIYQVAKAVVVPTTYTLGAGVVLGYGTLSHLAAHTVLAAADCAYMVLSLEGPRWVLYAVQGKLGKGDDLPPGTVVNLKKMQRGGETIKYIPLEAGTMAKVVKSVYRNLPQKRKKSLGATLSSPSRPTSNKPKKKINSK